MPLSPEQQMALAQQAQAQAQARPMPSGVARNVEQGPVMTPSPNFDPDMSRAASPGLQQSQSQLDMMARPIGLPRPAVMPQPQPQMRPAMPAQARGNPMGRNAGEVGQPWGLRFGQRQFDR